MAEVARSARASMDTTTGMLAPQFSGKLAGEDLGACDYLYLKNDGLIYRASGAAADAKAKIIGITPKAVKAGQPVTPFSLGTVFRYGDAAALVPGNVYFLSGVNPGKLADAASAGDAVGVGQAIDDQNIRVIRAI